MSDRKEAERTGSTPATSGPVPAVSLRSRRQQQLIEPQKKTPQRPTSPVPRPRGSALTWTERELTSTHFRLATTVTAWVPAFGAVGAEAPFFARVIRSHRLP